MSGLGRRLTEPLLTAAEVVYAGAIELRNRRYERRGATRRARIPVVSIGNLVVGGTGKTPLVAWLAECLRDAGRQPGVVSRGYGGEAGRGPLVVSRGAGPLVPAQRCGDEPWFLASTLVGVPVVVGSNRFAGAEVCGDLGADVAILDDGFQHRRLHRDLDLVLLRRDEPFGNGRLLPAGPLREPPRALARADIVVLTRCSAGENCGSAEAAVRNFNRAAPIVRAGHRALGFVDVSGAPKPPPARAVAFCGIGDPERFRDDLEAAGLTIVAFRPARDHHPYSSAELSELRRIARHHGCGLVTTEKDLVRIASVDSGDPEVSLVALRIVAEVHDPGPLFVSLRRALDPRRDALPCGPK